MPESSEFDISKQCCWFPFSDEPILKGSAYMTRISEPCVVFPQRACDGKWHLFFHSWIGIHHFISDSGIAWEPYKMIVYGGKSPFIYQDKENYSLLYVKEKKKNKDSFTVEAVVSTDLRTWSKPKTLLFAEDVPFASDYCNRHCISHPQLVKMNGFFRLYFGASEFSIPGTSIKVPRYLACADSLEPYDSFRINEKNPVFDAKPDSVWENMAAGNVSFALSNNRIYAFQCALYWNAAKKNYGSALLMKSSADGILFNDVTEPLLTPAEKGWASGMISSCFVAYKPDEKSWYCYFSAVSSERTRPDRESIGLLFGSDCSSEKFTQLAEQSVSDVRNINEPGMSAFDKRCDYPHYVFPSV